MPSPTNSLELTVLPAGGSEPLFDGLSLQKGIHLRWSFQPELGFPRGGFYISRRSGEQNEFARVAHVTLPIYDPDYYSAHGGPFSPSEAAEALRRITGDVDEATRNQLEQRYGHDIDGFIDTLHKLMDELNGTPMHRRVFESPERGLRRPIGIPRLDLLLLSSLDPYAARMLGLYWIDTDVDEGEVYDYRVEGDWNSQVWPENKIGFQGVSKSDLTDDHLVIDEITFMSRREMRLEASGDIHDPLLRLTGTKDLGLRIVFPYPVKEVRLIIYDIAEPHATAEVPVESSEEDGDVLIRARDDDGFAHLELRGSGDGWGLISLRYRRNTGEIGTLEARRAGVEYTGAPPVAVPRIIGLRQSAMPPMLNDDGQAPTASQVEVHCQTCNLAEDSFRPVRLHVGRSLLPGESGLVSGPAASWPLQESTREVTVALSTELFRGATLSRPRIDHSPFPGQRALELDGSGMGLRISHAERVNDLGNKFTMEAWIYATGYGADGRPTILGNDYQVSYWFGLAGSSNRLRFYLNGAPAVDSTRAVELNRWHRVAVTYKDGQVRFYIDGFAEDPQSYEHGSPHPNEGQPLGIGTDPGRTGDDDALYGFEGQIAYVGIWNRALASNQIAYRFHRRPDGVLTQPPETDRLQPVLYQHHALVAGWSLAGTFRDKRTSLSAKKRGSVRFQKGHPEEEERQVLALAGEGFLELSRRPDLQLLGERFTLQARIWPEASLSNHTLVGNNRRHSFWLGLDGDYRLLLWLNGEAYRSTDALQAERWSHATVNYDGKTVRFYLNGWPAGEHDATLGPVAANPAGVLCLGAESGSTPDEPLDAFRGRLADVRIWREAFTPAEAETQFGDAMPYAHYIDHWVTETENDDLYAYHVQGIDLFGRASAWSQPRQIDVRDKAAPPPPVSLQARYRPLRGRITGAPERITEHVEMEDTPESYERTFYHWRIDTDIAFPASFSHLLTTLAAGDNRGGYDLQISREITPEDGSEPKTYRQTFEIVEAELDDAGHLVLEVQEPPFAQLQPLPDDVATIPFDLDVELTWGWSGWQLLFAPDASQFRLYRQRGPVNTARGRVTAPPERRGDGDVFEVDTDLHLEEPENALRDLGCVVGRSRYRIESHTSGSNAHLVLKYTARPIVVPEEGEEVRINLPPDSAEGTEYDEEGAWDELVKRVPVATTSEDDAVTVSGGEPMDLGDHPPPTFDPVAPQEFDAMRELGVSWLPGDRLFTIEWTRFQEDLESDTFSEDLERVFREHGISFTDGPTLTSEEAGSNWRLTNKRRTFTLQRRDDVVGIYPESALRKVVLSGVELPDVDPSAYIPGALVGFNLNAEPSTWEAFVVAGHVRRSDGTVSVYVEDTRAEERPESPMLALMTYYPGLFYRAVVRAPGEFAAGEGTAEWLFGITTADHNDNESAVTRPANVIAVNRQRPPAPARPQVHEMAFADYYGQSRVEISWESVAEEDAGIRYNLYRAVDTALFARDLEQRRLRQGYYSERQIPDVEQVLMADDPDFADWLAAYFPERVSDWQTALFADKPAADASEDERDAWQKVTPVWRAWAERFYPARTDMELVRLAERLGNESAFALINNAPLTGDSYNDEVNGRVRNRYFYRLRSLSASLQPSAEWSTVSWPEAPPKAKPPRRPTFTRIAAGDRQVTLRWVLNRASEVKEYRLYRVRVPEKLPKGISTDEAKDPVTFARQQLQDLRWWGKSYQEDERWAATIADPRLKVEGNTLTLPSELPAESVEGVFRVDEFDLGRDPLTDQPGALNYLKDTIEPADEIGSGKLRRIADGTPVVVVYRDPDGVLRVLDRNPPAVDYRGADGEVHTVEPERFEPAYLRIKAGALHLSDTLDIDDVLGLYRLDEFDRSREPTEREAENLFTDDSDRGTKAGKHVLTCLAPVANGTPVVVVYGDSEGAIRVADRRRTRLQGEYTDEGLLGRTDYGYRLVAVDEAGNMSEGSKIVRARTLEITPPAVPRVSLERREATEEMDQISLMCTFSEPGLELMVQRRTIDGGTWTTISDWQEADSPCTFTYEVYAWEEIEYRVWSRTGKRTISIPPPVHASYSREGAAE